MLNLFDKFLSNIIIIPETILVQEDMNIIKEKMTFDL